MLKEMVQNADDAGATRVHFVWDARPQKKESLLSPEMKVSTSHFGILFSRAISLLVGTPIVILIRSVHS